MKAPFEDQQFKSFDDWVSRATRVLTAHPEYFNAEHAQRKGWSGHHFTALCYDQRGRRCKIGRDFKNAQYPVWWIWPDQIPGAIGFPKAEETPRCVTSPQQFFIWVESCA